MSESKTRVVMERAPGLGLPSILFVLFLGLKLAEIGPVATWSWWWVTSPLWISVLLWAGLMVLVLAIAVVAYLLGSR